MMQGQVRDAKAHLPVALQRSASLIETVDFVVDTGFEGALTLPMDVIVQLGLPKQQEISAKLADGSRTTVGVHRGTILWHGKNLVVAVLALDSDPLLGTSLLDGNHLFIDWADQGEVRVEPRP